ncbi:uncharacterized protein [Nicotiana sylvestris]|uniref:uncharacterized protein n=1 Tax=Nicotiana sylvestris TaxID=4096 RepID=UPI00388CD68F
MEDIFKIKQGDTVLLKEFVDKFQHERMMLPQVPDNWGAIAFASNLNEKSSEATRRLKKSLREFPATTWNDIYNRYNTKLRIEEDTIIQPRKDEMENPRYDPRSKDRESGSSSRFEKEQNMRDTRDDDKSSKAKIGGYSLNVSTSELVAVLRSMGDKVRWPKEMRSNPNRRNPNFLCEFHNDHGHKIADCRLLQGEVENLLKQGYLTELFSEKGKQAYMKNRQEPPKPPSPKRTVNVISGGEKINGVSKITVTHGKRVRQVLEEDSITFDDANVDGVLTPHNDVLVPREENVEADALANLASATEVTNKEKASVIHLFHSVLDQDKNELISDTSRLGTTYSRKFFQSTRAANAGKLSPNWEGPYKIHGIAGKGAYELETLDGKILLSNWNVVHLKKYYF